MKLIDVRSLEIFKQNVYEYISGLGLVSNNAYLSVVMTNNCQRNCVYCINSETDKSLDLPLDKAMDNIVSLCIKVPDLKEVILLGGEPTMHPDLLEFIKRLRTETDLTIRLTSNGIKLKDSEFLHKLIDPEYGVHGLNISFHDDGFKLFNKNDMMHVYQDIKKFNSEIKVRMNTNVWKYNLDSVADLTEFILSMSAHCDEMRISNIIPKDSFSVNSKNNEFIGLSDEEYNKLFTDLCEYYNRQRLALFENKETLGFVRYVLIPLDTPVIINWNIGSKVCDQVCENNINDRKINTFKCLVSGDISLSWNKDNIISSYNVGETFKYLDKTYLVEEATYKCDGCCFDLFDSTCGSPDNEIFNCNASYRFDKKEVTFKLI